MQGPRGRPVPGVPVIRHQSKSGVQSLFVMPNQDN